MKPLLAWAAVIGLVVFLGYAGGCSLDKVIKVDVPRDVRVATGAPERVTLREARDLVEDYDAQYLAGRDRLVRSINDGAFFEDLGVSLVNDGLPIAEGALATVPAGGILVGLLASIAGYITRGSVAAKKEKQAEDKGYDMGRKEAIDTIKSA